MKDTALVISAIAAIAWPIVLAFVVLLLLPTIRSKLNRGDVTLKMFGVELSMEEASANLSKVIDDMQNEIRQLKMVADTAHPGSFDRAVDDYVNPSPGSVLWVDDHPENNALEIGTLMRHGVSVDRATSTNQALEKLAHGNYTKVITDMERTEAGQTNPQAGIELMQRMKKNEIDIPVYVYCSDNAVQRYRKKAFAAGAAGVTASPLALFDDLEIPIHPRVRETAG